MGKTEDIKKLKEKYCRPKNVGNLQVPKVAPVIWRNLSVKGKSVDAAMQKTLAKFLPGMIAIIQQLDILAKKQEGREIQSNIKGSETVKHRCYPDVFPCSSLH